MRTGLSLMLAEYVSADELDHPDTADFQVVCPACRESVVLVARTGRGGRPSRYLAHRRIPPGGTAECELRVEAITTEARAAFNAVSRGQTLERFLAVLPRVVALDRAPYGGISVEGAHHRLRNGPVTKVVLDFTARIAARWDGATFDTHARTYESLFVRGMHRRLATPFALDVQMRTAKEVYLHLLTAQGAPNRAFLIRHATLRMLRNADFYARASMESDLDRDGEGFGYGERQLREIDGYIQTAAATGTTDDLLAEGVAMRERVQGWMAEIRGEVKALMDGFAKASALIGAATGARSAVGIRKAVKELSGHPDKPMPHACIAVGFEFVGTLMRLPYAEMAANHVAGRDILHGLEAALTDDLGVAA